VARTVDRCLSPGQLRIRYLHRVSGSGSANEQPFRLIVSGIGLVTGLIALAQPLLGTIDTLASITMLGVGLSLAGIVSLAGLILGRFGETTP